MSVRVFETCSHLLSPHYEALEGGFLLLYVSGGSDSVSLLPFVHEFCRSWFSRILVVHFNFGLRGEQSRLDEMHVKQLCRQFQFEFQSQAVSIPRGNLQQEARQARREYFQNVRRLQANPWLMLGHNAEDSCENFWITLVQGRLDTRLTPLPIHDSAQKILRPFAQSSREDLRRELASRGIAWREDQSNASPIYLRNRIRSQQGLQQMQALVQGLQTQIQTLQSGLHQQALEDLQSVREPHGLDVKKLSSLGKERAEEVLVQWLKSSCTIGRLDYQRIHHLIQSAVLHSSAGTRRFLLGLSPEVWVELQAGCLRLQNL